MLQQDQGPATVACNQSRNINRLGIIVDLLHMSQQIMSKVGNLTFLACACITKITLNITSQAGTRLQKLPRLKRFVQIEKHRYHTILLDFQVQKSLSGLVYYFKTYIHQFYRIPSCKYMVSPSLAMRIVSLAFSDHQGAGIRTDN